MSARVSDADLLAAEDFATSLDRRFYMEDTPPGPCGLAFVGIRCDCNGTSPSHPPARRDPRQLMAALLAELHELRAAAAASTTTDSTSTRRKR